VFLAAQGFEVTAVDASQVAVERGQARAKEAGVSVRFLQGDVLDLPDLGPPFPFVFDRGCYQHTRAQNRLRLREILTRVTEPGGLYLTLVPSANEKNRRLRPPKCVFDYELCLDLVPLFEMVHLREARIEGRVVEGQKISLLGWSVLRRRTEERCP
jgi:SAM-dependent methyltransferase